MSLYNDQQRLEEILADTQAVARAFLGNLASRPAGMLLQPMEHDVLPEEGLGARKALSAFREKYENWLAASPGPRYLGFVTGGTTPAALAGDWLVSAYDQNVGSDGDSIATTVEHETLRLLRALFRLPDTFEGAFVTGATQANFVALATARQWAAERQGIDVSEQGLWRMSPVPVLGGSPHASVTKALAMLGMGRQVVELLPHLPDRMAIDPQALAQRLAALNGAPAIVVASAGEVNTGDFDDLVALAELCKTYGAWLHVDGAFGLFAACDPTRAPLLLGLEAADSIIADGHKWLNVPYDSGFVFTRHLALHQQVFKVSAAYLGDSSDLSHRTPEDSRRFRALPAWMTLMAYGRSGYRDIVARCCSLAQQMARGLEDSSSFELLAPVRLNIVCFALRREADAVQRDRLLERLKEDGRVLLTPTFFSGRPAIRAAFSNWSTSEQDIPLILSALEECSRGFERSS